MYLISVLKEFHIHNEFKHNGFEYKILNVEIFTNI